MVCKFVFINMNAQSHILKAKDCLSFFTAGNAYFTLRSTSGTRFTYRINKHKKLNLYFVSVLTGSNNISDYTYLGTIKPTPNGYTFGLTAGSTISGEAKSFQAFNYVFTLLINGHELNFVEVWHEGKCGRCGRKLTDPQSIESGFGSYCIGIGKNKKKKDLEIQF